LEPVKIQGGVDEYPGKYLVSTATDTEQCGAVHRTLRLLCRSVQLGSKNSSLGCSGLPCPGPPLSSGLHSSGVSPGRCGGSAAAAERRGCRFTLWLAWAGAQSGPCGATYNVHSSDGEDSVWARKPTKPTGARITWQGLPELRSECQSANQPSPHLSVATGLDLTMTWQLGQLCWCTHHTNQ
jgi:hypothetical protein